MKQNIIAFYGEQGAGKSSAAGAVAAWTGWMKLSFADPLYDMVSVILGTDARKPAKNEPREELCGKSIRQALQLLGTEYGRGMLGDTVWLRHMSERMRASGNVVIDDLRFANEYEFLRERGAFIVEVRRSRENGTDGHASEQDRHAFDPDLILDNTVGDLPGWQFAVRAILKGRGILV